MARDGAAGRAKTKNRGKAGDCMDQAKTDEYVRIGSLAIQRAGMRVASLLVN